MKYLQAEIFSLLLGDTQQHSFPTDILFEEQMAKEELRSVSNLAYVQSMVSSEEKSMYRPDCQRTNYLYVQQ